ncbi:MAG: hypothetical protein KAR42_13645 [candidate division Zixibacteria bacterium]|nr:hypothetical protein [candidate division Zixibacteria bacterium]
MRFLLVFYLFMLALLASPMAAGDITVEEIVSGVYERDSLMHSQISDLTMTAESYARKLTGDGDIKEEKKFIKKYYFKRPNFKVELLEYYLEDEKQDDRALEEEIEKANDRRKKKRMRDASIDPLKLFGPEHRGDYDFELIGIEVRDEVECYHLFADCKLEDDKLLEGDFWFSTNGFNPVFTEFHPSKMPSKIKVLDMKRGYGPVGEWWLPQYFSLRGSGKVLIFIKFNFAVEEFYSNFVINSGLDDSFFKEEEDED